MEGPTGPLHCTTPYYCVFTYDYYYDSLSHTANRKSNLLFPSAWRATTSA